MAYTTPSQITYLTPDGLNRDEIQKTVQEYDKYKQMGIDGFSDDEIGYTWKMNQVKGGAARKLMDQILVDKINYEPFDAKKHNADKAVRYQARGQDTIVAAKIMVDSRWDQFNRIRSHSFDQVRDANYFFHPNEVTVLQKTMQPVLRWGEPQPIVPGFFNDTDIGRGMNQYTYFKTNDVPAPGGSKTFEQRGGTKVSVEDTTVDLFGLYYDFHLSMVQKDASMSGDPIYRLEPAKQQFIIQELTKSLATYQQGYRYLGTAYNGLNDVGITGLLNDSSITPATTIGNNGSLVAYGNIRTAANQLANKLLAKKIYAPYILDLSPGVVMQANLNQDAVNGMIVNELSTLFAMNALDGTKMFSAIRMNPHMITGSAETNTTAAMACYKVEQGLIPYFKYVYSYPMAYYPMPQISLGVDGKILFMGRTVVEQANAIAFGNTLTVNVF